MTERKVENVEPDSPERCQAVHVKGQCVYKRCDGSQYCPMHGGNKGQAILVAKAQRQYQLAKWQGEVDAFADEDAVKSLRGEIGITRLLLQSTVSRCKDAGELIMYSGKINELTTKLEKLVVSCHRLESSMGNLLDKTKVLDLASQMVAIISRHIDDADIIQAVSDEIVQMVLESEGSTKEIK
jgi:hypothetical protein